MDHNIFISYSRQDFEIVNKFVTRLIEAGYIIWIDREGIVSGDQFKKEIVQAIKGSVVVVFFSSANSNASEWTVKEISYALKKGKTIIPVRLDETEYDDSIDFDLIYIDYIQCDNEHPEQTVERLIGSIRNVLNPHSIEIASKSLTESDSTTSLSPEISYQLGSTYFKSGHYEEAVIHYRFAAEQGLAAAQNDLGDCYFYGNGVKQDYNEAVKWYRIAAEQGDAQGQNNLGYVYEHGYGVDQDFKKALKWYTLAAEKGYAAAQFSLGKCFLSVDELKNYHEAAKWFKLSAEQGYADAQNDLGYCYEYGYGVDQNYKKAKKWYKLAAEQGHAVAQHN